MVARTDNLESALAADIAEYRRFNTKRLEFALAAGDKLATLKASLAHGEWLPTLERLGLAPRTASLWMAAARGGFDIGNVADLGLARTAALVTALDRDYPEWRAMRGDILAMLAGRPDEAPADFALWARVRLHWQRHERLRAEILPFVEALESDAGESPEAADMAREARAMYGADHAPDA